MRSFAVSLDVSLDKLLIEYRGVAVDLRPYDAHVMLLMVLIIISFSGYDVGCSVLYSFCNSHKFIDNETFYSKHNNTS